MKSPNATQMFGSVFFFSEKKYADHKVYADHKMPSKTNGNTYVYHRNKIHSSCEIEDFVKTHLCSCV